MSAAGRAAPRMPHVGGVAMPDPLFRIGSGQRKTR